jgi:hypothetical protein
LFDGFDLCDVVWPKTSRLFSWYYWNRKDVLPEQRLSKADYQDFHQVNWDNILKKSTPDASNPDDEMNGNLFYWTEAQSGAL